MAWTHKNSKGQEYGLHRRDTQLADGRTRTLWYFSRETAGGVDALPAGYTVVEARTGLPLLKKV
ncbi:MAG: hypothetical protein ACKOTZ_04220 [Chloroflexota bacterium]